MNYRVVLQRGGRDVETLYWNGAMCETKELARVVALAWDADVFLVMEVDGRGAVICLEQRPFDGEMGKSHGRSVHSPG